MQAHPKTSISSRTWKWAQKQIQGENMPTRGGIASNRISGSVSHGRWQARICQGLLIAFAGVAPTGVHAAEVASPPQQRIDAPAPTGVKPVKQKKRSSTSSTIAKGFDATPMPATAPPPSIAKPSAPAMSLDQINAAYGYKGWNIPFPSFADSVMQDVGGFRSALAKEGFGLIVLNAEIVQANMLDTPRKVPSTYPACTSITRIGGICAGNQAYFGQSFGSSYTLQPVLTYDLGRIGLTGGQLAFGAYIGSDTDEAYLPTGSRLSNLSWYQPLFDRKLEAKIGWFTASNEVIGTNVGGSYANPFGPSASIPAELGLSTGQISAPAARLKWNISDSFYSQFLVQRSFPVNGPTGNAIYDEFQNDGAGLRFNSPVQGTGTLYLNEVGYQTPPLPGAPFTWIRAGAMYNTSEFKDLSKLATGGTKSGVPGFYLLADRQLWQQDPSSPLTAFRGIYVGGTAMYTPPETAAFYQYYEARLYWLAPFASRPRDLISLVYNHNEVSPHLVDFVNGFATETWVGARYSTNTITAAYTTLLPPNVWLSLGVAYTDHPSISHFPGEGSSLNFLGGLFVPL
jgi:porin